MKNSVFRLALFRFQVLLRQKMGWGVLGGASLFFPFALFLATSSYVRPDKIYWDLCSGFCFLVSILLVSYLGTHLFQEENNRKTLSFVLTHGSTREKWVLGNFAGISLLVSFAVLSWTLVLSLGALIFTHELPPLLLYQAQFYLLLESFVILAFAMLFSFFLRPLLAWLLLLSLTSLLHSKGYLETLIVEANYTGPLKLIYNTVIFVLNFLPPLEWWDIRMFVGFDEPVPLLHALGMLAITFAWTTLGLFLSRLKMEMIDL